MRKYLIALAVALTALCVGASAASAAPTAGASAPSGQAARGYTCAEATAGARFAERRVKKVRKRWRNGFVSTAKYQQAKRIYKAWLRVKAQACTPGGGNPPGVTPPTPPLALTASEIINRLNSRAQSECDADQYCYSGGARPLSSCDYITTYQAACYGWNYEGYGDGSTCEFREVINRSGYNGVVSYFDTSYNGGAGWYCHF